MGISQRNYKRTKVLRQGLDKMTTQKHTQTRSEPSTRDDYPDLESQTLYRNTAVFP